MSQSIQVEPEYVYVTIPAEYICVYHRILAMLADYGEEMLKDCKASCTDRNSGVIECKNMFDAAVAARKLGKDKLAETLIKYIKAKINQIYQGKDNSTSFIFPVDANGRLKAFVSCGELPKFEINPEDGELYEHEFGKGFDEHFTLGPEDYPREDYVPPTPQEPEVGLVIDFTPSYEMESENLYHPCGELLVRYDGEPIDRSQYSVEYYFDNREVENWESVNLTNEDIGEHRFNVVIIHNNKVKSNTKYLTFTINN